jgi:hypothetical protein
VVPLHQGTALGCFPPFHPGAVTGCHTRASYLLSKPVLSDRVMSSSGPRSGPVHRRKQGADLTNGRTEGVSWNQNSSTTRG